MSTKINADVQLDDKGERVQVDEVSFAVYSATYKGKTVPCSFASLLLNEETKKSADELFNRALQTIKIDEALRHLLSTAGASGINAAVQELEKYEAAAPKGKVAVYRNFEKPYDRDKKLVLTNGEKALAFSVRDDRVKLDSFPPNVYLNEERVWYVIDQSFLNQALMELDVFFGFLTNAHEAEEDSYTFDLPAALRLFFNDREASLRELERAKIYKQFVTGAVKCSLGYLVLKDFAKGWARSYLITTTGEAYVFARRNHSELKDAVLDIVQGNSQIRNLKPEVLVGTERQKVASAVGKIAPALTLILLK
jgi:hypothetical protein